MKLLTGKKELGALTVAPPAGAFTELTFNLPPYALRDSRGRDPHRGDRPVPRVPLVRAATRVELTRSVACGTIAAPSASARSFWTATTRGSCLRPQSVVSVTRSGSMCFEHLADALGDLLGMLDLERADVDHAGVDLLVGGQLAQEIRVFHLAAREVEHVRVDLDVVIVRQTSR